MFFRFLLVDYKKDFPLKESNFLTGYHIVEEYDRYLSFLHKMKDEGNCLIFDGKAFTIMEISMHLFDDGETNYVNVYLEEFY